MMHTFVIHKENNTCSTHEGVVPLPVLVGVNPCRPKNADPKYDELPHVTLYEAPVNVNANAITQVDTNGEESMLPPKVVALASSCGGGHMAAVPFATATYRELVPEGPGENVAHTPVLRQQ